MSSTAKTEAVHALASAPFGSWGWNGPADVKLCGHVRNIRSALEKAKRAGVTPTDLTPEAYDALLQACDIFLNWHSRVEASVDVEVELRGRQARLIVRIGTGGKSTYEFDGGRWRSMGGPLCAALDIALEIGCPIAFISGLETGLREALDAKDKIKRGDFNTEFIDQRSAASLIGVPEAIVAQWVEAQIIPFYTLAGAPGIYFRATELKTWAKGFAKRHGGLDVGPSLIVTTINDALPCALVDVPTCIRSIDGLRAAPVVEDACGIYFLCHQGEVVYVGQSAGIMGRISTHKSEGYKTFDRAFFFPCRRDHLDHLEREMIDRLLPCHNADSRTRAMKAAKANGNGVSPVPPPPPPPAAAPVPEPARVPQEAAA